MLSPRTGRRLAAAFCLCAPCALAAAPAANPFTKVPALPTACYSSQDQWAAKSEAAFDAVQADHYAQDEINSGISQQANEADPMAVAARLQQAMMDDPQNAQKMMEQMMARSQQAQSEVPAQHEKEQQFQAEAKALKAQYGAALQKAMGAANARLAAMQKRGGGSDGSDITLRYGDPGEPAWAHAERMAILRERDQGYAANCAAWWSATGKVQALLNRYKSYLVNERVPFEKQFDAAKLQNFRTMGVDATGWLSTADHDAAEAYLKMAQDLYSMREEKPRCGGEFTCQ